MGNISRAKQRQAHNQTKTHDLRIRFHIFHQCETKIIKSVDRRVTGDNNFVILHHIK